MDWRVTGDFTSYSEYRREPAVLVDDSDLAQLATLTTLTTLQPLSTSGAPRPTVRSLTHLAAIPTLHSVTFERCFGMRSQDAEELLASTDALARSSKLPSHSRSNVAVSPSASDSTRQWLLASPLHRPSAVHGAIVMGAATEEPLVPARVAV